MNGDGVSIEAEVWRLPPAAFAAFVEAIPAPLGIGTVSLADGMDTNIRRKENRCRPSS